ncbi:MAG TPA: DUF1801 domain-containing protein [Thermomicrobiaceae bacterium]|nr:DUF1801 domain-containing protein [Thermomicrobiaceae bacterium]
MSTGTGGKPATVDEYLASLPDEARATLEALRRTIRAAAPEAEEAISYGMPSFRYHGQRLIHFAAAKRHCALYGTARGSTIRFPIGEPPDEEFVRSLVAARIADIEAAGR